MDEQQKKELGEQLLAGITRRPQNEELGRLVERGAAAREADSITPLEARFFEQVDELRESDPREFEQLSPEVRAGYGSWKWARENG